MQYAIHNCGCAVALQGAALKTFWNHMTNMSGIDILGYHPMDNHKLHEHWTLKKLVYLYKFYTIWSKNYGCF